MHLLHLFQDPSGVCDILAGMVGYRATSNKSRVHTISEVFCDIWILKCRWDELGMKNNSDWSSEKINVL